MFTLNFSPVVTKTRISERSMHSDSLAPSHDVDASFSKTQNLHLHKSTTITNFSPSSAIPFPPLFPFTDTLQWEYM